MASRELFVDTSAWFPLVLRKHPQHKGFARELTTSVNAGERIVTTNLVIAETHALLQARGHSAEALQFVQRVRGVPNIVVYSTEALELRAISDWLARYDDQGFSLTDALSFAVMKERSIVRALTLDAHFSIAGFEPVTGAR